MGPWVVAVKHCLGSLLYFERLKSSTHLILIQALDITMSLDKNLFTLTMTPSPDDPRIVDLVDPSGIVHYRKQRIAGPVYKIEVYGQSVRLLSLYPYPLST
jgi:hypothetical protein